MAKDYRVLCIQSHVVSGYVGNKCATFPLQLLGFEVDSVNSVQFSNHTGYPHMKGQSLHAEELHDLYEGLKLNKINKYTHVLTGFCYSEDFLNEVADVVKDLKASNNSLVYLLDPVLGDNGKMYVPSSLLRVYKERLIPLCDIITPNQFELELLTDTTISGENNVVEAMSMLHDKGVENVFATSIRYGDAKEVFAYASIKKDEQRQAFKLELSWVEGQFTGTGDLLAASILAWMTRTTSVQDAFEKAMATVYGVLQRTHKHAQEVADRQLENRDRPEVLELRLVQCKDIIENPHSEMKAVQII